MPILISGFADLNEYGHAWVIDGVNKYKIDEYFYRQDNNQFCHDTHETLTYFHCKWGEVNGKNNGYFLFENILYNKNIKFIRNIRYTLAN